jgi:membrane-associated phospholipid phosphatase
MVLGVHYPTDVVAGAVLGAAIGGLVRRKLNGPRGRKGRGGGQHGRGEA